MIQRKLNCVLVDDDLGIHQIVDEFLSDCPIAELGNRFLSPDIFLKAEPKLDFDVCLLDIVMPEIDGFTVADILRRKQRSVIFISGAYNELKFAIDMVEPLDVMSKPFNKERLFKALEKAYKILSNDSITSKKEFELFCVAGTSGKINIHLPEIVYVKSDSVDPRNKIVILKNGENHTIMNSTFQRLLNISSSLMQVNRTELISFDAIRLVEYDVITINGVKNDRMPKSVTLSNTFRKEFMRRLALR